MATKVTRWLCNTCQREWVWGSGDHLGAKWAPENGCTSPACSSLDITQVEFSPSFPGLDIPREAHLKPIVAQSRRNDTLAMSSPEFS